MKKIIIAIMTLIGVSASAHGGKRCGKCYPTYPYVYADNVESMCLTKISVCSIRQTGASFFFQFSYGYKENRVLILSNGKQSRYTVRDVANVGTFVDMSDLKSSNADVAVGGSSDKVMDEKEYAMNACKSEQEVWKKTYGFCK